MPALTAGRRFCVLVISFLVFLGVCILVIMMAIKRLKAGPAPPPKTYPSNIYLGPNGAGAFDYALNSPKSTVTEFTTTTSTSTTYMWLDSDSIPTDAPETDFTATTAADSSTSTTELPPVTNIMRQYFEAFDSENTIHTPTTFETVTKTKSSEQTPMIWIVPMPQQPDNAAENPETSTKTATTGGRLNIGDAVEDLAEGPAGNFVGDKLAQIFNDIIN
ncbi:hypothetical protein Dda_6108 [Drechslerella dactyloides]|uniref:Uncharacterized protein n=1 Tax=Drechslerella dactyloides TaxID=74499 RepID=A0AAD6NI84_DREDA|nr:hypothetical protein Dda_6108 [Drechslerella dactyloides]